MRRTLLAGVVTIGLWAVLPLSSAAADDPTPPLIAPGAPAAESPTATPIKHLVYVMQEDHSFDEYFGTYPQADGIPDGVCQPWDLNDLSQGCVEPSPRGDAPAVEIRQGVGIRQAQIDSGRMDGFVAALRDAPTEATSAMAYDDASQLPWYWNLADQYVLFDRFFSSTTGAHVPDHLYWVAGTGGPTPSVDAVPAAGWGDGIPTVFDRLQAAGIPWKVYVQNYTATEEAVDVDGAATQAQMALAARMPLLEMPRFHTDPARSSRIVDLSQYYDDLQQGTFPAVAFVVSSGASTERPPADVRTGQTFVRGLVNELMRSSTWPSSALLMSYDDSGGSYDHVPPPARDSSGAAYGVRVPGMLISPYARQGVVDHTTLDATSALAFIRENWGIEPLAVRDREASSFLAAFDFGQTPRPPMLAPATRDVVATKPARTTALYPAYGVALLIPLVIGLGTWFRARKEEQPA